VTAVFASAPGLNRGLRFLHPQRLRHRRSDVRRQNRRTTPVPGQARLHRSSLHREKKRLAIGDGSWEGRSSEAADAGSGRRSVARPGPERVGAVTRSFHANSAPFTAGARLLRSPIAPCASGASRRRRPRASRRDHRCRPSLSPRRRSSNRRVTTSRWPSCARARSA
jgi:hypothetical protein